MSVSFTLESGSSPLPTTISWSGVLSCSVSGAIPWTLTLAPGQTSATAAVAVVAQGESCEYQPGAQPEPPAGYFWGNWLTSAGITVPTVDAGHTAMFSAYLLPIVPPTALPWATTTYMGVPVTMHPNWTKGTAIVEFIAFDNGSQTKVVPGEGTWTIMLERLWSTATFTPVQGFVGQATTQSYTITDARGLSATGTLTVTVKEPVAGSALLVPADSNATVTIAAGREAVFHPRLLAGTGQLSAATFDNGSTTKVVAGQGTWVIALADNVITLRFTPVAGFIGTSAQDYLITDSQGLEAMATLTVVVRAALAATGSTVGTPIGLAAVVTTVLGVALVVRRRPRVGEAGSDSLA